MAPTRRGYLSQIGGVGGVLLGSALAGCADGSGAVTPPSPEVRVGSKPFAEQEILGQLAYERFRTLEGVQAVDEVGYGNSAENWAATADGRKHLYWEYTGTAWRELPPRREIRLTDPAELYERAARDAREQGLRMASPAPFSNEYVLVADRAWSERTGVATLGEFADHLLAGNTDLAVAVNEEFYRREDAWRGVTAYYGVGPDARSAVESGSFIVTSVGLTYELLADGRATVASGFATDPQLASDSLVVLADDRDYFLPYQPSPTAHAPTVEATPAVFDALAPVAAGLDESTMRRLNGRVLLDGETPNAVARAYLDGLGGNP